MAQLKKRNGSGSEGSGAVYNNAVRLPSASTKSRRSAAYTGSSRSTGKKRSTSSDSSETGSSSRKGKSRSAASTKRKTSSKMSTSNLRGNKSKAAKSSFREMVEEMMDLSAFPPMAKTSGSESGKSGRSSSASGRSSGLSSSSKSTKTTSAKALKDHARSSSDEVLDQINSTFMQTVKDAERAFASKKETHKLKVIPLGGMQEIGKNMTLFEYDNDIIIVDVGVAFPEESMLGVDSVIQDYTYVLQNKDRVRGIFLTHGHEDHIGSLPFLMRELKCPLYGGKLTIELARHKLMDAGVGTRGIELVYAAAGDVIKAGNSFSVEFIRVNHSIADAFAFAIRTPIGNVIHTGDFKIDFTPINGEPIDLGRFAEYGRQGVLLMLAESTNVEIPGSSPSEKHVGESFQRIFQNTRGRIIIATFSSHVHRMQQIFTAAEMYNRKVALIGRSMLNTFSVANSLGYINMNPSTLIDINDINKYEPEEVVILTTGSQAEPMSALSRMAFASHRVVDIHEGDTVILSAHPIPGNEKPIYRVINELFRRGAHVIYESLADVHVSGHAYLDELTLIHTLVKPKFFVPCHGEYRMLFRHAELAKRLGTPDSRTFILNNGDVLEVTPDSAKINGYVPAAPVLIDGAGAGDIDNRVFRDRRVLADDGVVSVSIVISKVSGKLLCPPVMQSVGFLFESEAGPIQHECSQKLYNYLHRLESQKSTKSIREAVESNHIRDALKSMLYESTKRRPLILINVSEI